MKSLFYDWCSTSLLKEIITECFLQLPDGANSILIGQMSAADEPLAFVGGNCAILGFDAEGQDKYWTVSCAPFSLLLLYLFTSQSVFWLVSTF